MSLTINETVDQPSAAAASPTAIAAALAERFAHTAAARDLAGGTPKAERDLLRASGLLRLSIPKEYGGLGASWAEILAVARQLTRVDSSVGHVFAFHHLQLASVRLSRGLRALPQNQLWRAVSVSQGSHWAGWPNRRTVASCR